jgi:hypothetical protein
MIKKWWVPALVFTLALSLTSCSSSTPSLQNGGQAFAQCNGDYWSFDVYVEPSTQSPGEYELRLYPVSLNEPGDLAQIVIANNSGAYEVLKPEVTLEPSQEIFYSPLSASDLTNYDVLVISPYQPGVSFLQTNGTNSTFCTLPPPLSSN